MNAPQRGLTIAAMFLFAGIILTPVVVNAVYTDRGRELPVLGEVTPFSLTNQDGQPVQGDSLKGKVWVADFVFTTCAGPCPTMSARMAELHHRFAKESGLRFVTVTVNPEQDTPEVLKDYAARFKADTQQWQFLTGEREAIRDLAVKGFHVGSVDEPIFHSTRLILVDGQGRIRGYYDGLEEADVAKLADDITLLL